jgi:release factor glutamine methyltransferase
VSATTLGAWLRAAAARISRSQSPRLDARVLAKWALRIDDAGLIAHEGRVLRADELEILSAALDRRIVGEPVAYITGEKEFWGLTIQCRPPMLLPRPDSETLIAAAVKRRERGSLSRILDLGTGTGCLLLAALSEFRTAAGIGVDYHDDAVALARENAVALGLAARADIRLGSWADGLDGAFDLVLANPPYVPEAERGTLAVDIRDYEDPRALFAGADGLSAYRTIFADAPRLLAPGGLMIVELGAGQKAPVVALARAAFPMARIETDEDLGGRPRALVVDGVEKTV